MAYALPCGGEDMDKLVGGLSLGQAKGGEPFFPLGAEEDAPAWKGRSSTTTKKAPFAVV